MIQDRRRLLLASDLPSDNDCVLHSIAHVTDKSVAEVWAVAKSYYKRWGIHGSHEYWILKALGFHKGSLRFDLTYGSKGAPGTHRNVTLGELVGWLRKEPRDARFLIPLNHHSVGWNHGMLVDVGNFGPHSRVLEVSEIKPLSSSEKEQKDDQ